MEALRRYFPFSFREKKEIKELIINILVYLAAAAVIGLFIGLFAKIPVMNWIFGILGTVAEIYTASGIAISVFDYVKRNN